jgi:hypothetical protein
VWTEIDEYRSLSASSGPMRARGHEANQPATVVVVTLLVSFLGSAPPAQAQLTVTASDSDDVADRLDIRFATLSPESRDRSRITLTFWNDVPPTLLEQHSIRMELSGSEDRPDSPGSYAVAFFLNSDGLVRMTWGEAGSNCCFVVAGQHPNDFTYSGVVPFSWYEAEPQPNWLRGVATERLHCGTTGRRACVLFLGRVADRTRCEGINT